MNEGSKYLSGPLEIVLNITNRCNLCCLHCFNDSGDGYQRELNDEQFITIVREICEIKPYNVCFSGGEPLLRQKLLLKSVQLLSNHGIRVSLVTNGMLINRTTLQSLWNAGVQEISVSLDGVRSETHNRLRGDNTAFKKAFTALEILQEESFPSFEAAFTVTKINVEELEDFIYFFDSKGYPLIIVQPLILVGRAAKFSDSLAPTLSQYRQVWRSIYQSAEKRRISVKFGDTLNHIMMYDQGYPYYGMEVKADGRLIPSPYIPIELGNLLKHSIAEYWEEGWANVWKLPHLKQIISQLEKKEDIAKAYNKAQLMKVDLVDFNRNLRSAF